MLDTILLLHGALGTSEQFNELKELLSAKYNVLVLNFEGHADSKSKDEFTLELFVANALELLDRSKVRKTHIFGYSMGGYVALKMALKEPDRISKIVTLGTKFNWSKEATEKEVQLLNPEIMEQKVPRFAEVLSKLHYDWKSVVNRTSKLMISIESSSKLLCDDLGQIKNDVLIGIGTEDRMVSLEESLNAVSCLGNARIEVLENTHHPFETVDKVKLMAIIVGIIDN